MSTVCASERAIRDSTRVWASLTPASTANLAKSWTMDEAEKRFVQVTETSKTVLGPEHSDTLASITKPGIYLTESVMMDGGGKAGCAMVIFTTSIFSASPLAKRVTMPIFLDVTSQQVAERWSRMMMARREMAFWRWIWLLFVGLQHFSAVIFLCT